MITENLPSSKQIYQKINNSLLQNNFFIWLVFAILSAIGIIHHEMWRDEVNTWLIVRDNNSLRDIVAAVNYQGHPLIWPMLLTAAKSIWNDLAVIKIVHWIIGTLGIGIFLKYSPFKQFQKVLFIFGYLPLYQYMLVSKNYSLGMLSVFGISRKIQIRRAFLRNSFY